MCRLAVVLLLIQFFMKDFGYVLSYNSRVYCSKTCEDKGKHIACHNRGSFSQACYDDAEVVPMSENFKQLILTMINDFRNKVARGLVPGYPPAARMLTTQWSNELAKLAELSIKRCSIEADNCRNTEEFEHVGQVISRIDRMADEIPVEPSINEILKSWRDANKLCDSDIIDSFQAHDNGNHCSQFTQLVQSRASHVGCALLQQSDKGVAFLFFLCNFSRGNIGGRAVYKLGRSGKLCERGTNIDYPFLCSPLERLDVNAL